MIKLMQWPSTKQLLLLWLLLLGIFSSYARHGIHVSKELFETESGVSSLASADSCTADFIANSLNNKYRLVIFTNLSTTTIGVPDGEVVYKWTFGDGILSYDKDPRHSYTANGTYNVCLIQTVRDSVTLTEYCVDTICKSVVVNYVPPACDAKYVVDTANSYFGNVIVWNSSQPNSIDTLNTVYYRWYFGDGDSSDLAFPSHTYSNYGEYEVCLTMWSYDSINNLCSDTHCDTFGMDSSGVLMYKGSNAGFSINVMDPYRVSIENFEKPKVEIYPNPAREYVNVVWPSEQAKNIEWQLLNVSGKVVKIGKVSVDTINAQKISVEDLNEGLYFLRIGTNSRFPVSCYKLRVDR